jgi:dihydrofolate reductase
MKTILIFVSTLDGKITKWGDSKVRSWSSKNDQDYFDSVWNDTRIIIMGSGTYNPDPVKPDSIILLL